MFFKKKKENRKKVTRSAASLILKISRKTLFSYEKDPKFPGKVKFEKNGYGYYWEDEIEPMRAYVEKNKGKKKDI